MSVSTVTQTLLIFKTKIEDAVQLVPEMSAEDKLKAVQFWNVVSEKLQEIVNNSAADISALALKMEKQERDSAKNLNEEQKRQSKVPVPTTPSFSPQNKQKDESVEQAKKTQGNEVVEKFPSHASNFSSDAPNFSGPTSQSFENHINAVVSEQQLNYLPPSNQSHPAPAPTTPCPSSAHANIENLAAQQQIEGTLKTNIALSLDTLSEVAGSTENSITNEPKIVISALQQEIPSSILETLLLDPREKENNLNSTEDSSAEQKKASTKKATTKSKPATSHQVPKNDSSVSGTAEYDSEAQDSQDANNDDDGLDSSESNSEGDENGDLEEDEDQEKNKTKDATNKSVIVKTGGKGDGVIIPKKGKKRGKTSLTCEWCFKEFSNSSALTSHRWVHTKPYTCEECDACFSTRGNLVVHQRRHTGEKPFGCTLCNARFSTKGNLKRHIKTHSGAKPWICTACGGRFTEKKSLKVHMRRHTGEKPYQCKICGKRFSQTGILQTHMAMHLDQKSHLCEHCGKSFRQKSQLRLHMMRHKGVRNHVCSSCPAKFLTKGDLERHNRIHTGERPFVCELCGKTFTRQQSLNEHMNRHYGLKPYTCKYCGKVFAEMSACYKHAKQHERANKSQTNSQVTVANHQLTAIPVSHGSNSESLQLTGTSDVDQIVEVHHADFGDSDSHKFTVLVHTGHQPLEVASEMTVVQDQTVETILPNEQHITVAVPNHMTDFATISLLASASSYQ